MEAARQDFRQKMTLYNQALAKMAGVAERLKVQVKAKAARAQDLERRILANHAAGNLELAGTLARELQELKADLNTDTQELQETEEAYQANLRQAKLSQQEFQDKVRKLEKQLSQVQIKEAQAEAATALSSVAFKVGDLGDTMKTVEEVLQKRYEMSAGKARVARDMVDMETIRGAQGARADGARRVPREPGHPGRARGDDRDASRERDGARVVSEQPRFTSLGKFVSFILVLGLIGLGAWMVLHNRGSGGGDAAEGGAEGTPDVVDVQVDVPALSPPAPVQITDNIIPVEISEYAGYRGSSPPMAASSRPRTPCSSRTTGSRCA
jgi:phage shock protein A